MNDNIEKTCECISFYIAKMFEEYVNNPSRGEVERQLVK
jgi:hypothetical protein